jgi:hypothetical protein
VIAPTAVPAATPVATLAPVRTPAETPPHSPAPDSIDPLPGPPSASLVARGAAPAPGMLGSYTWLGAGSDSPWIVPPTERAVRTAGPFTVTLQPGGPPISAWTARWAPILNGAAGASAASTTGNGSPIVVTGPPRRGTWGLLVDVQFGEGHRAAFSWRLEPSP